MESQHSCRFRDERWVSYFAFITNVDYCLKVNSNLGLFSFSFKKLLSFFVYNIHKLRMSARSAKAAEGKARVH
jgi:hypothetical protein